MSTLDPNIGLADPPAIPFYKSQVLMGALFSVVLKLVALLYPKFSMSSAEVDSWVSILTIVASFVGDAIVFHGRVSATAQPVTVTQGQADEVAREIKTTESLALAKFARKGSRDENGFE